MRPSPLFTLAAVLAGLAVALGAFGAHGLTVAPDRLATYDTAAQYHMTHALAMLLLALAIAQGWDRRLKWAAFSFLAGILLFSGSLYTLVLTDTPWLGAVAPIGGSAFMLGWGLTAWFGHSGPQAER